MYKDIWSRLASSPFRSKFHLKEKDREYVSKKGFDTIQKHAVDFMQTRIAPLNPKNDGKQTPMKGHPVFIAQHATATCCRGCIEKWYHIPSGRALTEKEQAYLVCVIMTFIEREMKEEKVR